MLNPEKIKPEDIFVVGSLGEPDKSLRFLSAMLSEMFGRPSGFVADLDIGGISGYVHTADGTKVGVVCLSLLCSSIKT